MSGASRHTLVDAPLAREADHVHPSFARERVSTLVFEVARRAPDRVALVAPDEAGQPARRVRYGELAARVELAARGLVEAGVRPREMVVIALPREVDVVVAMLAVWAAGAAFVPVDPTLPAERLAQMIAVSCATRAIVASGSEVSLPSGVVPAGSAMSFLTVDALVEAGATGPSLVDDHDAEAPAYVMFTSGSTGTPKGVVVPHRAITRLVVGSDFTPLDERTVFLQLAPLSFDASTLELWGPLVHGGVVVLYPGGSIPDLALLERVIKRCRVSALWLTASLFNTVVDEAPTALETVDEILTGGEALSVAHVRRAQAHWPTATIVNGYGPTENTTFTACLRIPRPLPEAWSSIPIGMAVANTEIVVVDAALTPVALGELGQLVTGGEGLALGYAGRPDLTAERFVTLVHEGRPTRFYRTGDRVRRRPDGAYEFFGRDDDQVKIRGFRIELEEVRRAVAQHASVLDAAVVAREDGPGGKRLVAYVVPGQGFDEAALRSALSRVLPDYMVPAAIVVLERLPMNANGKLDKRALPAPTSARPAPSRSTASTSERGAEREVLAGVRALWQELLGRDAIDDDESFFDAGGTSLLAVALASRLRATFALPLSIVELYRAPTLHAMTDLVARRLGGDERGGGVSAPTATPSGEARAIAVVGMAGRFPGAGSVEALWELLLAGRATTTMFTRGELDPSLERALVEDPSYVPARGVLDDAETFDARHFGMSQREAEVTDPQQRLFLEVVHDALEDAGYDPARFEGRIGVFGGSGNTTYWNEHLARRPDVLEAAGAFLARLGNEKDFLATRVSYKLGLRGPSVSVNTACSTSLVAIGQAIDALREGRCELAIAGGVTIHTPQRSGYLHQEDSMLSPDGRCRPFDASARGTMFNNGCAVVVLKRLAAAEADGDRIDAVLLGHGINNDGRDRMSFSAPSVSGQVDVIRMAQRDAGVSARSISYVEAHGTATPVGDPIEVTALTEVFRASGVDEREVCALGSVKSNVGHLVSASGVTGVIKAALAARHGVIPGTLHFTTPNPELGLEAGPFFVHATTRAWDHGARPRRAGVSSFGVGGTNAHVILEEPPRPSPTEARDRPVVLTLSARTPDLLARSVATLAQHLERHPTLDLADVAYTLHVGRREREVRVAFVVGDREEALTRLRAHRVTDARGAAGGARLAFVFPGQGSQTLGMGRGLRTSDPVLRAAFDEAAFHVDRALAGDEGGHVGGSIAALVAGEGASVEEASARLRETSITQPALFVVGYALARKWIALTGQPATMLGHSIGEWIAATIAGVFTLEEAARLVVLRGRLAQSCERGAMLGVRASRETLGTIELGGLDVAAYNAPQATVLSGPTDEIERMAKTLEARGIASRVLPTSHAFHSRSMEPVMAELERAVAAVGPRAPRSPFVSGVTGLAITDAEATSPAYWARHLREPVEFARGLTTLFAESSVRAIELGPRATSTTLARQESTLRERVIVPSLGDDPTREVRADLEALALLWASGVSLDWGRFHEGERLHRVALPTSPYDRVRAYVEAVAPAAVGASSSTASASTASAPTASASTASARTASAARAPSEVESELEVLVRAQLALMARQLELVSDDLGDDDDDDA